MQDPLEIVKAGYNRMARVYLTERSKLKTFKYVEQLIKLLPKNATVLDIGCGAGVPVDDELLRKGFGVIGIDNSSEQIKLARQLCKGGDYQVKDAIELVPKEYQVEAVISLFTLFHIPRAKQGDLLGTMATYLPEGGYMLVSMGEKDFEGTHPMLGEVMWSSQWGVEKNKQLIKQAGMYIIKEELLTTGGEKHQIILARKS